MEDDNMNLRPLTISNDTYLDLAQNGARTLLDIGNYRVLDGLKDDEQSYFVKDFSTEQMYMIDMVTCYELVTAFHCGGYKPYILEQLEEIIESAI
jgi:hypothetical protein